MQREYNTRAMDTNSLKKFNQKMEEIQQAILPLSQETHKTNEEINKSIQKINSAISDMQDLWSNVRLNQLLKYYRDEAIKEGRSFCEKCAEEEIALYESASEQ